MKNPLYTLLTPILVIAVTLLGFILLRPAEAPIVYWVTMAWVFALEMVFFIWLKWDKLGIQWTEEQTNALRLFSGTGTVIYVGITLVWIVAFYFLRSKMGENADTIYMLVISCLTVLWFVFAAIMGRHDAAYISQQKMLENNTISQREFVSELKGQAAEHQTEETKRAWATLIRDAESVAPGEFAAKVESFRARAQKLL
ncbi:MAG: hypothetical protein MJZ58_01260 [Paludibacteraceae bacterium]|nr:hypothetical protein [Paludibacteraceae bacterium]